MSPEGQIAIAATLAGLVAICATVAIERLGGLAGGLISTVPTTIVPAAAFMWLAAPSTTAFADAMGIVPVGMLLNAGFLWLWRIVPPRIGIDSPHLRLAAITVVNVGVWLIAATIVIALTGAIRPITLGWSALAIGLCVGILASRGRTPAPKGEHPVGPVTLLLRGLAAAAAIGLAVLLAQSGAPVLAGIASVFPAIFLTSMVALWLAQGEAVPTGAIGPMMLGGMSVSVYAMLAILTFPAFGIVAGSLVAWLGAVGLLTVPAGFWLHRGQGQSAGGQPGSG